MGGALRRVGGALPPLRPAALRRMGAALHRIDCPPLPSLFTAASCLLIPFHGCEWKRDRIAGCESKLLEPAAPQPVS